MLARCIDEAMIPGISATSNGKLGDMDSETIHFPKEDVELANHPSESQNISGRLNEAKVGSMKFPRKLRYKGRGKVGQGVGRNLSNQGRKVLRVVAHDR